MTGLSVIKRRKTPTVAVGDVLLGSPYPVVIQAMTDTPTADVAATARQSEELILAGAEIVRWTVNDDAAAQAVPEIIRILRDKGYSTPIVGDFHFNGHQLLSRHRDCAKALAKYRVNPGNLGKGKQHDENFSTMIKLAMDHDKVVRIGVNWGSLDQELFSDSVSRNARLKNPRGIREVTCRAMVQSALDSAAMALKIGLRRDKLVLSVKMSQLEDMVNVYERLAAKSDFVLHLGLTEAGGDVQGIVASSAALAILLKQGIGDTIRVSLTPQPNAPRSREVEVCRNLLQSMGIRFFSPTVVSCPGCGRTASDYFQRLADEVRRHVQEQLPSWKIKYPGVERLTVAVMGCVVNGPGESQHADIGISLPGKTEQPLAPVYIEGKKVATLQGEQIAREFITMVDQYIGRRFAAKKNK